MPRGVSKKSEGGPLAELVRIQQERSALSRRETEARQRATAAVGERVLAMFGDSVDAVRLEELLESIQKLGVAASIERLKAA